MFGIAHVPEEKIGGIGDATKAISIILDILQKTLDADAI